MYDDICNIVSEERIGPYLAAAGFNKDRALALYAWNMKISASFYPLMAATEICLRNRVLSRITEAYGPDWWSSTEFQQLLGTRGKGIVLRARKEIENRNSTLTSGRLTAELSFGFWQKMLLPKYEDQLWSNIQSCFPDLPDGHGRSELHGSCDVVRLLRNRISHHEQIFRRNLTEDYAVCMRLLEWLSPPKAVWLKPQLQVMRILRERP